MPTFVCLVRGVNVGGHNRLRMADLKATCESAGLTGVRTHLQSGNAVFRAAGGDAARIEKQIENGIRKIAKIEVSVILRTKAALRKAIEANPFPDAARRDPSHLMVVFLAQEPAIGAFEALRSSYAGPEKLHAAGRELYVDYGASVGQSKLTNTLIERKLGVVGTTRNWNTTTRLLELAEEVGREE